MYVRIEMNMVYELKDLRQIMLGHSILQVDQLGILIWVID